MIILTERNMQYRQILTDGRPLPADPNPTWNGYSTAKWEGDTLVVHTIGFRDDLWLDSDGNPLTNAGKVTEKIRRPDYGTLEIEITVDDPKAYTAPWTIKMIQPIVLDSELLDYYCLENEKDFAHMVGSNPRPSQSLRVAEGPVLRASPEVGEDDHTCDRRVGTPERGERVALKRQDSQENNQVRRPEDYHRLDLREKQRTAGCNHVENATAELFVAWLMYTILFPFT